MDAALTDTGYPRPEPALAKAEELGSGEQRLLLLRGIIAATIAIERDSGVAIPADGLAVLRNLLSITDTLCSFLVTNFRA